jgi:asparagine synthase (glutamine-hydrolysing)
MCGFAVYTGSDKMTRLAIASEFQKLQYRGPDNTQMDDFSGKGWMGFHRLKIIDTSDNGNQPLNYRNINLIFMQRRIGFKPGMFYRQPFAP